MGTPRAHNAVSSQFAPASRGGATILRRHWLKITAITVVAVVTAIVLTLAATPKYTATATVSFRDVTQDLGLVGTPSGTLLLPAQLAAAGAQGLTRPENLALVQRRMGGSYTVDDVRNAITTAVDTESTLVEVTAESTSKGDAAKLANVTAAVAVADVNDTARRRYKTAAASIQRQIQRLPKQKPGNAADPTRLAYADELSRLSSLAIVAQPAELSGRAVQPESPSSPKPLLNIAIGLIFGGALAIGVALLSDRLDKKIRDPDEMLAEFGLPMLGRVREASMGDIVPLQEPKDEDEAVAVAAYGILRRNIELLNIGAKPGVVTVTSGSPEEGKTTVSVSLAGAFAVAGRSVLLVDCDLRKPTVSSRLNLDSTPGLAEFLAGQAQPQDVLRVVPLPASVTAVPVDGVAAAVGSVVVVPAGTPPGRPEALLGSERFTRFLDDVRNVYDVVILDTGPLLPVADTLELLPLADIRVICGRVNRTTRYQAAATTKLLQRLPAAPTGLVVTGLSGRDEEQLGYGDSAYAYAYVERPVA